MIAKRWVGQREPHAASPRPPVFSSGLTDRASAAVTWPLAHYLTFLRTEAAASCMRLLGRSLQDTFMKYRVVARGQHYPFQSTLRQFVHL